MTLKQVAGELQSLLLAYDAQLTAGQTLRQASQRLAEAMAVLKTDEVTGDEAETLVDSLILAQTRAFQDFQAAAQTSERAAQFVQRRFGLQQWAWEQIHSEILATSQMAAVDGSETDVITALISQLRDKQRKLAELIQEVVRLHTSIEGSVQQHLHQLADRFRIIRQGTMATRAYDSGMAGYSGASALFIDRTR